MSRLLKLLAPVAIVAFLSWPAHPLGQARGAAPAPPAGQAPAPGRGGPPAPPPAGGGQAPAPGRAGRAAAVPLTPRASAAVDLTGYWTSVVTEDWRYRMVTPPKGDRPSVPVNAASIAVLNAWDPAKDEAAGEQCKGYGAVGAMRQPGRLHITWGDDSTLKVETEAGTQTRLFHFAAVPPSAEPSWQGDSVASWEYAGGRRGRSSANGSLKVVTRRLRPGYLQKNGVPYGANAVLTEYFDRMTEPNGDSWLVLTATVEDPQYLSQPFTRSSQFKRLPDNFSGWEPEVCSSR